MATNERVKPRREGEVLDKFRSFENDQWYCKTGLTTGLTAGICHGITTHCNWPAQRIFLAEAWPLHMVARWIQFLYPPVQAKSLCPDVSPTISWLTHVFPSTSTHHHLRPQLSAPH